MEMMTRKSQKSVAITALFSVVIVLLLSLNFQIWSGVYEINSLEDSIAQVKAEISRADRLVGDNSDVAVSLDACLFCVSVAIPMILTILNVLRRPVCREKNLVTLLDMGIRLNI